MAPFFDSEILMNFMAKTTHTDKLVRLCKATFKKITGFPRNTPNNIIEKLTDCPTQWMKYFETLAEKKIMERFNPKDDQVQMQIEVSRKPDKMNKDMLNKFPDSLPKIFYFAAYECPIHNRRIDHTHFCEHINMKYTEIQQRIFTDHPDDDYDYKKLNQKIGMEYLRLSIRLKNKKKKKTAQE
jgi:hypothetical protein